MSIPMTPSEDLLTNISQHMPVYDGSSQKVGSVKSIQFADDTVDESPIVEDPRVQRAPEPLRTRLVKTGFIRIDTGILSRDRYALTDQISDVSDQGVQLKVSKEELITL